MTLTNEPFDIGKAIEDGLMLSPLTHIPPQDYVNQEIMKSITGIGADNK